MTNTQDAKEKVCLIDGSGYIFRAFFASPQMTNPEGLPVNAVYGFLNMFLSLTANIKCDYCLVLFDAKRQNFRNEFFPEYKATRPELPPELKPQFALIHEAVEALNLHWLQMEGYEADDLIATYADLALKEGKDVTIVSADKDLMQLIRPGVEFYDGMKNKFFTPEDVKEKFGVYPERVTDVQALAGDSTDNIPGIPGIGLKTAAELVNMFGSLEGVLEHAAEIKQNKRRELVMAHKEDALVSQKLVTLKPDVPVELPLKDLRCMAPHQDVLISLLDRHAFKSLKNKALNWLKQRCSDLPEEADAAPVYKPVYTLVQTPAELDALAAAIRVHDSLWESGTLSYGMSQYEIAQAYYLWLCDNCRYDSAAGDDSASHLAYGALVGGLAVCDGYTGAYNLLLKLEGIDCTALFNDSHIWTLAELDGTTYHIDVTWGDQYGRTDLRYFGMSEEQSYQYHPWSTANKKK